MQFVILCVTFRYYLREASQIMVSQCAFLAPVKITAWKVSWVLQLLLGHELGATVTNERPKFNATLRQGQHAATTFSTIDGFRRDYSAARPRWPMTSWHNCPLCQVRLDCDEAAFAHHVNSCLDASAGSSVASSSTSCSKGQVDGCPVCSRNWQHLRNWQDRQDHVEACLSKSDSTLQPKPQQPTSLLRLDTRPSCPLCQRYLRDDEDLQAHGQACAASRDQLQQQEARNAFEQSDIDYVLLGYENPARTSLSLNSEQVPAATGLFPILQALLERSHSASKTPRSSILCHPSTAHATASFGDFFYGCGYRCATMLFSSMRQLPQYQSHLSQLSDAFSSAQAAPLPSIKDLQHVIESAWAAGYDPASCETFEGRIVNKRKWIGTTELYTIFTYLGIRVRIVDFPDESRHTDASTNVLRWVKEYFKREPTDSDPQPKSPDVPRKRSAGGAFDLLMRSGGSSCKQTTKQPLFLQHQGHSRVIIGIELGKQDSDVGLLMFDPAMYASIQCSCFRADVLSWSERIRLKSEKLPKPIPSVPPTVIPNVPNGTTPPQRKSPRVALMKSPLLVQDHVRLCLDGSKA